MRGVDQSAMRGSGEGSSLEEGISGGGGSRRRGQTAMPSREEGGGVVHLRWSRTDEGETERGMMATAQGGENMGEARYDRCNMAVGAVEGGGPGQR
jgi:hypothetical protein